jgi:hypothetical protein
MSEIDVDGFLTARQYAERLGCDYRTVLRLVQVGALIPPAVLANGQPLFKIAGLPEDRPVIRAVKRYRGVI